MAIRIKRSVRTWNLHTHSSFSANDALSPVSDLVAQVERLGQKALGLTDHGNMAGAVQLYAEASKAGIAPFPGTELYVVHDRADKKAKRYHMCIAAYSTEGYQNLVRLNTLAQANFHYKPLLSLGDLAGLSELGGLAGIAGTSGCFFSMTSQLISTGDQLGARNLLASLSSWFPTFFVELQNHNIDHGNGMTDDDMANALWSLADDLGLPCVITQDAHYALEEDKDDHDTLKRLVAFGPDGDDAVFPGDGFHLADDSWFAQHHPEPRLVRGVEGLDLLLARHSLTIPELDTYHYNIPFTVADPQGDLARKCFAALEALGLGDKVSYFDRLADELEIVRDTGMAGYLLLVAEVTDWCRENRVFYQARGSASGSIICWLLEITQADPLKYKLRFERFISRDRTKPPDIDLDVEWHRRLELIGYLSDRFAVAQIGTWLQYSITGDEETGKGSLRVRYFSRAKAVGKPVNTWAEVPAEDKAALYRLGERKAFSAYGVHAAGMIVATTHAEIEKLVPMMKIASSGTVISQYEMDDVEKLGLVKLDVLGLKTLSVLHLCMDNLGRDVFEGLDWIPLTDAATFRAISRGETDGVFQLEGGASRQGCRYLKPTTVKDIIAAMALFRPATMDSGATDAYINRKHKQEQIPLRHELIARNTKDTYGIMLFQEQVIAILRDLGMDPDNLTAFLKAVKASNENIGDAGKVIAGYQLQVSEMAQHAGMSAPDFHWLWDAIEGFAKYGFNQAHSTAYGLTAYRCAYLATQHPLDFLAAVLAVAAGTEKESMYVRATKSREIRIMKADVNYSGVTYAVDPKRRGIRRGLLAIDGIGEKTASEVVVKRPEGGYVDLTDFCSRVSHRKVTGVRAYLEDKDTQVGAFGKLWDSGALESLDRPVLEATA